MHGAAFDEQQAIYRAWLKEGMRRTNKKATPFATEAGIAASTILRALDEDSPSPVEERTIFKLAEHWGLSLPPRPQQTNGGAAGFHEPDVVTYEGELPPLEEHPTTPNQSLWQVKTRALELAGCLPGDLLLMDQTVEPRDGDIVCAQIYDLNRGTAETVLRRYRRNFLAVDTNDPDLKDAPFEFVDSQRVKVMGTVVKRVWTRPD